jgi:hypothetical protein
VQVSAQVASAWQAAPAPAPRMVALNEALATAVATVAGKIRIVLTA